MTTSEEKGWVRCYECGSWEARCDSDTPVKDCGCARCLSARLTKMQELVRSAKNTISYMECRCRYYGDGDVIECDRCAWLDHAAEVEKGSGR